MLVLDGKSVFGGIAIGKIALFEKGDDPVKRRQLKIRMRKSNALRMQKKKQKRN